MGYRYWSKFGLRPTGHGYVDIPAVQTLRQIWVQNDYESKGQVRLREKDNQPPVAQKLVSPYDTQARYSTKRDISWGVHFRLVAIKQPVAIAHETRCLG